jgi:hypothetical protein
VRVWVESVEMTVSGTGYRVNVQVGSDTYGPEFHRASVDVRLVPVDVREALLRWLTTGGPAEPPVEPP